MASISGVGSLGIIESERITISNNLIRVPAPSLTASGSTSTSGVSVVNLLGKERKITITGYLYGTNSTITSFVTSMNSWINDGRQVARVYTGTFESGISVLCDNFDYDYSNESPNTIKYSIEMYEGSTFGFLAGLLDNLRS